MELSIHWKGDNERQMVIKFQVRDKGESNRASGAAFKGYYLLQLKGRKISGLHQGLRRPQISWNIFQT